MNGKGEINNMQRIISLFQREWQQCIHDVRRFIFLFGAAVAYLVIFGLLYVPNIITHVPCIIYDNDQSVLSRQLTRKFEDSDSFRVISYATSEEEMLSALQEKRAYAAIEIPKNFSQKIKIGDSSTLLFMVNGSNIILTNITSSAAQNITTHFSDHLASQQAALRYSLDQQTALQRIAPIQYNFRILNNSTQGYTLFFLIGLALVAFQQGIFFSVGASTTYEYEHPELRSKFKTEQLLLIKYIFYWILSMFSYYLVVFLCHVLWNIPIKAPLWQISILGAAFCFSAIAFCTFFASLFRKEMQFVRGIIMYPVPAFIFSGYTWPAVSMPPVMQTLAAAFPLSWLSNTARELFLSGGSPHLSQSVLALIILGIVCSILAYITYDNGLKETRTSVK